MNTTAPPPNVIRVPGTRYLTLEHDTYTTPRFLKQRTFDLDHQFEDLWMVRNIRQGDFCFDVGAFIGYTAAHLISVGALVTAFEPQPDAFYCLENNSPRSNNLRWLVGDGSKVELSEILIDGNAGSRRTIRSGNNDSAKLDTIQTHRLDFLKIDVEGFEIEVLNGAKHHIEAFRPNMLIEVNIAALEALGHSTQELYSRIGAFGYSTEEIPGHPDSGIWNLACWHSGG